jgi:hypothetical protein
MTGLGIVKGEPDADELAALVMALDIVRAGQRAPVKIRPASSLWRATPSRGRLPHGPRQWARSLRLR